MVQSSARLPRFRQQREAIRTIHITPRDEEIIRQVARFRYLRSRQIIRALNGAPAQILRRLQALYHHGWLDRPRCQLDYYHQGGSRPIAYGLGSRGAGFMRRAHNLPFERMVWGRAGKDVGRVFLEHTLLIAEVVLAIEGAAAQPAGGVNFISSEALYGATASKRGREPFQWSTTVNGQRIGLIPDAVFALDFSTENGLPDRLIICLEADRGTMPVTRQRSPHRSHISRKLSAYAALWRNGAFAKRFGTQRLLVLTVTESADRAENIRQAVAQLPHGRGLFRTLTTTALLANPAAFLLKAGAGRGTKRT